MNKCILDPCGPTFCGGGPCCVSNAVCRGRDHKAECSCPQGKYFLQLLLIIEFKGFIVYILLVCEYAGHFRKKFLLHNEC